MNGNTPTTPLWEGERLVLERRYDTILPVMLMILGGLMALLGITIGLDADDPSGIVMGIVIIVIGIVIKSYCKVHLVVTTKRVFVNAPFGRRMNLPLNRTSAVGTAIFHSLYIGSSAGRIHLSLVPNHLEVYNAITALLNQVE